MPTSSTLREALDEALRPYLVLLRSPDDQNDKIIRGVASRLAAALATPAPELDVGRVKQAVVNVAKQHGIVADPPIPPSVASIFGYSTTPAKMDAEIAAEYARLGGGSPDAR